MGGSIVISKLDQQAIGPFPGNGRYSDSVGCDGWTKDCQTVYVKSHVSS